MPSRVLMLAAVLLFVNGCDYSQKKPETASRVLASSGAQTSAAQVNELPGVTLFGRG